MLETIKSVSSRNLIYHIALLSKNNVPALGLDGCRIRPFVLLAVIIGPVPADVPARQKACIRAVWAKSRTPLPQCVVPMTLFPKAC